MLKKCANTVQRRPQSRPDEESHGEGRRSFVCGGGGHCNWSPGGGELIKCRTGFMGGLRVGS